MAKRLFVTVPDDVYAKVLKWCERLAVSQSQLSGMALQAGLDTILRAYSPLEGIPPEHIAKIAAAMKAQGLKGSDIEAFTGGQTGVKVNRGTTARKTAKAKGH